MKSILQFLLFAVAALAADLTGNWKAVYEVPNGDGKAERTFVFKLDGDKVTGETISQFTGKSVIEDGKQTGDTLTFTINANFDGNDVKLKYSGKVADKEINFHVESADGGFSMDHVAKKVS
ncbi:MAG: hypothetical protein WKF37_07335 [Bryobacteraceae bacterium]